MLQIRDFMTFVKNGFLLQKLLGNGLVIYNFVNRILCN